LGACPEGPSGTDFRLHVICSPGPPIASLRDMHPRSKWLVLPVLVGMAFVGCGVDSSLTCGKACDPDANRPSQPVGSSSDAAESGDSAAGGGGDGAVGGSSGGANDGASSNDSTVGAGADGASEAGCPVCGRACCAPLHQCTSNGASCCSLVGGGCGDNSCCPGLVCTTAQQCATSCKTTGSCAGQDACCHGTYCDPTSNCVTCLAVSVTCAQDFQCCSGSCSNGLCRQGG
jgi:hypothetical protein